MKDTPTSHNHVDFRARYKDTYGFFIQEDGIKVPVYVSDVSSRYVSFTNIHGQSLMGTIDSGIMFEFIPIDKGFIHLTTGQTVYLMRVPARQWHRGICENNTTSLILTDNLRGMDSPNFLEIISAISKSTPLQRWQDFLSGKAATCVLSKQFALSSSDYLFFYNKRVGKVDKKERTITIFNKLIQQELTDLVSRSFLDVKVLVQ